MASFLSRDNFGPADDTAKSPKPAPSTAPGLNAFLGKGCSYEGKLTFEGLVRIDGQFKGEIFSNDTLHIGPEAHIEAQIDVANLEISGRVSGTINARTRVTLKAPARITGTINTPSLVVSEGVVFDGSVNMSGAGRKGSGSVPAKPEVKNPPPGGPSTPASEGGGSPPNLAQKPKGPGPV